jgi:hypothetical protein
MALVRIKTKKPIYSKIGVASIGKNEGLRKIWLDSMPASLFKQIFIHLSSKNCLSIRGVEVKLKTQLYLRIKAI